MSGGHRRLRPGEVKRLAKMAAPLKYIDVVPAEDVFVDLSENGLLLDIATVNGREVVVQIPTEGLMGLLAHLATYIPVEMIPDEDGERRTASGLVLP